MILVAFFILPCLFVMMIHTFSYIPLCVYLNTLIWILLTLVIHSRWLEHTVTRWVLLHSINRVHLCPCPLFKYIIILYESWEIINGSSIQWIKIWPVSLQENPSQSLIMFFCRHRASMSPVSQWLLSGQVKYRSGSVIAAHHPSTQDEWWGLTVSEICEQDQRVPVRWTVECDEVSWTRGR